MTVAIEHVRHRVTDELLRGPRGYVFRVTRYGRRFLLGDPSPAHEPATRRCGACG